jgi:hypothetical protein
MYGKLFDFVVVEENLFKFKSTHGTGACKKVLPMIMRWFVLWCENILQDGNVYDSSLLADVKRQVDEAKAKSNGLGHTKN